MIFTASGIKLYQPAFKPQTIGSPFGQITPDEIDRYEVYHVIHPGVGSATLGTAAAGTNSATTAFVILSTRTDFPRNLNVSVSGSNDIGGTATINGFDQFGLPIQEKIGFGTSVSPGTQAAGSLVFAEVTSGTWNAAVGSAGSGTPRLGYATGTANAVGTALGARFGLPAKIAQLTDVKTITWDNNGTTTAINSGSINSTVIGTTPSYYFRGTSAVAITDIYTIWVKSTYDNSTRLPNVFMTSLPGTP